VSKSGGTTSQLALHPGSGSERKNWPEANRASLLGHLMARTNLNLFLIGGEAEGDRLPRLAAPLPPERVALWQNLPLTELAGRLAACAAFIGHDSGITHLAAALGVGTLVLWGETSEAVWRPQGEGVMILREPAGLEAITVRGVIEQLDAVLAR
jgi:heptosyltransferase-2